MTSMALPYSVMFCSSKSAAQPPSSLCEGGGKTGWKTDLPNQRTYLILDLGSYFNITSLKIRTAWATHIELRAWRREFEARRDFRNSHVVIPKVELISMFQHKIKFSTTVSLVREQSSMAQVGSSHTIQKEIVSPDAVAAQDCRYLLLYAMCLWEPSHCIGLDSLEIFGSPSLTPIKPMTAASIPMASKPAAVVETKAFLEEGGEAPKKVLNAEDLLFPVTFPPKEEQNVEQVPKKADVSLPKKTIFTSAAVVTDEATSNSKPFSGCTIVLSGYQNPLRSEIRDKALSLGAKVVNDWGATCTHLICAVANTPKHLDALKSGHGYYVQKDWVLDSFDRKAKLKESDYRVGGAVKTVL